MENEIFETVNFKGWEGYEISTHGRLRNKKTGRILKSLRASDGTAIYSIKSSVTYLRTSKGVHHLVAGTFYKNYGGYVRHKDGNIKNNHISNLYLYNPKRKLDKELIQKMSIMIGEGMSNIEIMDVINPEDRRRMSCLLHRLREKKSYKDITSKYF